MVLVLLSLVGLLVGMSAVTASATSAVEIGPDADLCRHINALEPGGELVLQPGTYRGPCGIRASGRPGAPIVIRAKIPQERPRIVYGGRNHNVIEVRASHVVLRGLEFGPALEDVDAIRIFSGDDITVEDCHFSALKGIAVVANHANSRGIVIRRNEVANTDATAMYFGCHNGRTCVLSDLTIEGNYIHGVRAPDPSIGYGMQVKLNSVAVIRNNVVVDTKGPGIMVYGSHDTGRASVIERNFVMGSRTSSGIVLGGGPGLVRNNISVSNSEAGIGLEDYGRRGLLRGVVVAHNTLYGNGQGGITTSERGSQDVVIVNNAVQSRPGVSAVPLARPGLRVAGNVTCPPTGACFRDPDGRDFSPGLLLSGHAGAPPVTRARSTISSA